VCQYHTAEFDFKVVINVQNHSKRRAKKQQDIVIAAEALFLRQDYGVSMDHISKEAGVTRQMVYRYFASKYELFAISVG